MNQFIKEQKLILVEKRYGKNSCIFEIKSPNDNRIYIGYSGYGFEYIKNTYKKMYNKYISGDYDQWKSYYELLRDPKAKFEIIENNIEVNDQDELRDICSVYMYSYYLNNQLFNFKMWDTKAHIKCSHCEKVIKKKRYRDHLNNNVECLKKRAIATREEYFKYHKYYNEFKNGKYKIYNKLESNWRSSKLYYKKDPETLELIKSLRKINYRQKCKTTQDVLNILRDHTIYTKNKFLRFRDKYREVRNFI